MSAANSSAAYNELLSMHKNEQPHQIDPATSWAKLERQPRIIGMLRFRWEVKGGNPHFALGAKRKPQARMQGSIAGRALSVTRSVG